MTTEPTKEMIALARDVYSRFIIDNTPGAGPGDVPRFDDKAHGVRIALAAIQATTGMAADLIAGRYRYGKRGAAALRNFAHLKETPDV